MPILIIQSYFEGVMHFYEDFKHLLFYRVCAWLVCFWYAGNYFGLKGIFMRIDKFLSISGAATRSEASKAARQGAVTVNGVAIKSSDVHIDPEKDRVIYRGREIVYRKYTYIMLNKPEGYVSATDDLREKTVLELLPKEYRKGLFPCGRLDKNTLGLILLTDDGELAHYMLAPKRHVDKLYRFKLRSALSISDKTSLEAGAVLDDGYVTKPSTISLDDDGMGGSIRLIEGKYHQIKRMMRSVGNEIVYLERISFGPLLLDEGLKRGEWRFLTVDEEDEIQKFRRT